MTLLAGAVMETVGAALLPTVMAIGAEVVMASWLS